MDSSEEDDDTIFTTPDLNELWEDLTATVGYNHPDVLATTKGDKQIAEQEKRLQEVAGTLARWYWDAFSIGKCRWSE